MRIFILLTLFLFSTTMVTAQPGGNRKKAAQIARTGMELVSKAQFSEGADLLEQAAKLDPRNSDYAIRAGQIRFDLGDYERAKALAYPWTQRRRSDPRAWQLYGNSLDLMGHPDLAMDAYNDGIKKFPRSGFLYMEKGIVAWHKEDITAAQTYFEAGIRAQSEYAGNYYWAAKAFAGTEERLWAVIYGELFLNMERGTERTKEISALLYATYADAIGWTEDSVTVMKFSAYAKEKAAIAPGKSCFESQFETTFDRSWLPGKAPVSIGQLHRTRDLFLSNWFEASHRKYPNALFSWLRELQLEGRLEAYNYWLFFDGNEAEFAAWQADHAGDLLTFEEWFAWNKMPILLKNWPKRTQN